MQATSKYLGSNFRSCVQCGLGLKQKQKQRANKQQKQKENRLFLLIFGNGVVGRFSTLGITCAGITETTPAASSTVATASSSAGSTLSCATSWKSRYLTQVSSCQCFLTSLAQSMAPKIMVPSEFFGNHCVQQQTMLPMTGRKKYSQRQALMSLAKT